MFLLLLCLEGQRKFICCWWVYNAGSTPGGNLAFFFKKHILFDPTNPLEGIYPQIFSVYKMNKVLAAAVFTTAKDGKLTKCASKKKQLKYIFEHPHDGIPCSY